MIPWGECNKILVLSVIIDHKGPRDCHKMLMGSASEKRLGTAGVEQTMIELVGRTFSVLSLMVRQLAGRGLVRRVANVDHSPLTKHHSLPLTARSAVYPLHGKFWDKGSHICLVWRNAKYDKNRVETPCPQSVSETTEMLGQAPAKRAWTESTVCCL